MANFHKVCFVGLDRILGSVGLGLKRIGFHGQIVGVADSARIKLAWNLGIISDGTQDLDVALKGADLILLSEATDPTTVSLEQVLALAEKGATISEMTHVKNEVNRAFETSNRSDLHYVGFRLLEDVDGMLDLGLADKFFFEKKCVILTPLGKQDLDAYVQMSELIEKLGAHSVAMSPQAHDKALAETHQVPQIAFITMIQNLFRESASMQPIPEMLGDRIMREIASIHNLRETGWVEHVDDNRQNVLYSLDAHIAQMQRMRQDISEGKLTKRLDDFIDLTRAIIQPITTARTSDLIIVAGYSAKILERVSEILARSRISIVEMNKMEFAEAGTYRITLKSAVDRDKAFKLIHSAGIEVSNLS